MPVSKSFQIEGLAELQKRLDRLPEKLHRQVHREAMAAAAEELREEVSTRARKAPTPTHPSIGHLADNIEVTVRKVKDGYTAKTHTGDAFWGVFLEFGVGPERLRKYPFIRPAFDGKKMEMINTLVRELREGLKRHA